MKSRTNRSRVEATLLLAAFLGAPSLASAAEPQAVPEAPGARASAPAPGLVMVRNPETGALRPATAAELEKLNSQKQALLELTGRAAPPTISVHPDGRREARFEDAYGLVAVARRDPGGKIKVECFSSPSKAAEFLMNVETAPASKSETFPSGTRPKGSEARTTKEETK